MTDRKMIKSVGEHWVCSVLARHGWAPALTRDGLERTDILAVQATEGRTRQMVEVQVKTMTQQPYEAKWKWQLGVKAVQPARSDHEWYALVMLDPAALTAAPRTFIIPRDHAAAAAWIGHRVWQTEPGVRAGDRKPGMEQARVGTDVLADYEDRWDLLGTKTDQVRIMLPRKYRALAAAPRIGLPPEHPWKKELPEFEGA